MEEKIVFTEEQVNEACARLAQEIVHDLPKGTRLLVVCVLKGGYHFMSRLTQAIDEVPENQDKGIEVQDDFVVMSRFKEGQQGKEPKLVMDVNEDIGGRHVLVVDEVLEEGKTLQFLNNHLASRHPESIHFTVLVRKTLRKLVDGAPEVKYVGLDYHGNEWLGGMGMDDGYTKRNRKYIFVIPQDKK
jgi:hypoxanthine phosphoribosyltransferase